ncbi:MAG: hypothetical protein PF961_18980 [Planctomycetota bacterium]|jgi:hypothetical protein|nr:hypothetical protein [Planctomycetota bacterium]
MTDCDERTAVRGWDQSLEHGHAYLRTAVNGRHRPQVFTPEIIYQTACMAIERLFMAFLMQRGSLPANHTIPDLYRAVRDVVPVDGYLRQELLYLAKFEEGLCAVVPDASQRPEPKDVDRIVAAAEAVRDFVHGHMSGSAAGV